MLDFIRRCLRIAGSHSWEKSQTVTTILLIAAGWASWKWPWIIKSISFGKITEINDWAVLSFVLTAVILTRVALSPYWVFRQIKTELDALQAKDTQPIFIAIDRLRAFYCEGQRLENSFQVPEAVKPNFGEVEAWYQKSLTCAKRQVFKDIIEPKDLAKFKKDWDDTACRKAEEKLDEYGVLNGVDDIGRLAYRYVFGRVRRLSELIAKIEGESPKADIEVALQITNGLIGARVTNQSKDEIRVEDVWVCTTDGAGEKTIFKNRFHKFKRSDGMPHVMPALSSFEVIFRLSEGTFLTYGQASYCIEVKLENGQIFPSGHHGLIATRIEKDRRTRLEKIIDLIRETKSLPLDKRYDSIGAMIKYSAEIETEEETVQLCDELVKHGYDDPFETLQNHSGGALSGKRLKFLDEARLCRYEIKLTIATLDFARTIWSESDKWNEAVKAKRKKDEEGYQMYLRVVDAIGEGLSPLAALQREKVDELETTEMLAHFCDDLVKDGHSHPFDVVKNVIPQKDWLVFLQMARRRGLNLGDELGMLDALTDISVKDVPKRPSLIPDTEVSPPS